MKKNTINTMHELAAARGGQFLSANYLGTQHKHRWQCNEGHEWEATPFSVKYGGTWCPQCAGNKKLTVEYMHTIAAQRDGKFLSPNYLGTQHKHRWQCQEGHEWEATPHSVNILGTWCPECATKKLTIEDMHKLAAKRGGKFLSAKYLGTMHKHRWQCLHGHEWNARPKNVKYQNQWCPFCVGRSNLSMKRSPKWLINQQQALQQLRELAASKNGKCLAEKYENQHTVLQWQCEKGHKWLATSQSVKLLGSWCPQCAGVRKLTVEDMQALAAERGGQFISSVCNGSKAKHLWQCGKGHQWLASPSQLKHSGSWCPQCAVENSRAPRKKKS